MSRFLFIADLHLCQEDSEMTQGFLNFLHREARDCDGLYILGDLFEVWIGDDDPDPLHRQIASALAALPVQVSFMHGNRDFLVGKQYARLSHLQLLPDETVLEHFGQRVVIMHGDTLCTDDIGYQKFRAIVHNKLIQKFFLWLPLSVRLGIAAKMRNTSRQQNQSKSQQIMDVNDAAVYNVLKKYDAELLIHGHTHRPAVHPIRDISSAAQRMVLGAWHQQGWMIEWNPAGLKLTEFPW